MRIGAPHQRNARTEAGALCGRETSIHRLALARLLALDLLHGRQNALPHALPIQAALLEHCPTIGKEHLLAALALWEYVESSAQYIFGARMGDPVADRIVDALTGAPNGLTRTEISSLFGRHQRSTSIERALSQLRKSHLVEPAQDDTGGRPSEIWRICAK